MGFYVLERRALMVAVAVLLMTVPIALRVREDGMIRLLSCDECCEDGIREAYPGFSHVVL